MPLGLITNAVQGLAGVLLPSATVFLLLLCNDRAVLGPWVNGRFINLLTGVVIAVLLLLSVILTAAVVYPAITGAQIIAILGGGSILAVIIALVTFAMRRMSGAAKAPPVDRSGQDDWRMPPLHKLAPGGFTPAMRIWMMALRGYLFLAGGLVHRAHHRTRPNGRLVNSNCGVAPSPGSRDRPPPVAPGGARFLPFFTLLPIRSV